jgi:diacylglycerol kinase family enzyme
MPPLFIVFNVGSGNNDAETARAAIESACAAAGREFKLLLVDDPAHISRLAREAVALAKAAGGIVVAAGGDGTINAVAQATLGSGCAFGVLPQGTFNYFSRTHGIPADTAEGMQVLLRETPQPAQVGQVNDRVFLVNASLGLYPQVLEDRETWKKQLGRKRWVAFGSGLLTLLRGYRSLRLVIELNGKSHNVRTPTLFVGNNALQMEQLGFSESQAIDNGKLAGITLRAVSRLSMLWLLLRGTFGKLGDADQVVTFSFKRLTVRRAHPFTRGRVKVAVDGEIIWLAMPLEFRVASQPLLLVRPAAPAPERTSA